MIIIAFSCVIIFNYQLPPIIIYHIIKIIITIELRKKSSSLSSLNVRMIFEALAAYNPGFEGSEQQVSNRYVISYNHHYTIYYSDNHELHSPHHY